MRFKLLKQIEHHLLFFGAESAKEFDDPLFVLGGHFAEPFQSSFSEFHGERAAVAAIEGSDHQSFPFELIRYPGDVSTGNHQAFGDFGHAQAIRMPLELSHQVEAGERGFEILAQSTANMIFDAHGARQQSKPKAQRLVIASGHARLQVHQRSIEAICFEASRPHY